MSTQDSTNWTADQKRVAGLIALQEGKMAKTRFHLQGFVWRTGVYTLEETRSFTTQQLIDMAKEVKK